MKQLVYRHLTPEAYRPGDPVMAQVVVYAFNVVNRQTGKDVTAARMGTPEAIRRVKGIAILESKRLVDRSDVDCEGFYTATPPQ